jgi:hypothetical protein
MLDKSGQSGCPMLDKAAQSGRAPLREHRGDFYATPPEAVHALLEVESFSGTIWEPCCGDGAIVKVLCDAGHRVYATDLVDHGCPDSESRVDFLLEQRPSVHIGGIISNPPYSLASQFVSHALDLAIPKVAMLLRLAFLEGSGRSSILDTGLLARIYVFRNRLPRMHRHGWDGPQASSSIAFAWMIWESGWNKPAELHRISWKHNP